MTKTPAAARTEEAYFYPTLGLTVNAASKEEADEKVVTLISDKPSA